MESIFGIVCVFLLPFSHGEHLFINHMLRSPPPPEVNISLRFVAPKEYYFTQKVDHFNPNDLRTWNMRYLSSDYFFIPGAPMFIFLGGEGAISEKFLTFGPLYDLAQQHNGYMFHTEHRYYGKSYPTDDLSPNNLQYLTVDQALADAVNFILHMKQTIPGLQNSKVVVIGCSYAAALTTWLRMKFPQVVDIAYASGAPLRAVADFSEYLEVVNEKIKSVSKKCLTTIKETFVMIEKEINNCPKLWKLSQEFNTCKPKILYGTLFNNFISSVQYNGQGYQSHDCDRIHPEYVYKSIKYECNKLINYRGNSMDELITYYTNDKNKLCCPQRLHDNDDPSSHKIPSDERKMLRQWLYQTCTEFGYYQTTTSDQQPFGKSEPLSNYIQMCKDLFGEQFDEELLQKGIARTNERYGMPNENVTHLLTVHGLSDPWHVLGLLKTLNEDSKTIPIDGTSHCGDMFIHDDDRLSEAREKIHQTIAKWLQH